MDLYDLNSSNSLSECSSSLTPSCLSKLSKD